ncbi:MAG: beta-ketoacyl-[acyl-carrier-protein] synthase family protein [Pseudomonadota bacterium]
MRERIVVTGQGAICSLGPNAQTIWANMRNGTCGIAPLELEDRGDLKVKIAAQIRDMPDRELSRRHRSTMSKFGELAVLAAAEALEQAGLVSDETFDSTRAGSVIGTGIYGTDSVDQAYIDVFRHGKKRTEIFAVPKVMPSSASVHVSMVHGLKGPVFSLASACSSSNNAIATALDLLRAGRADVILAGGAETPVTYGILKAWESMRILAKTGCRPFSADREGLVLGDGAAVVALETESHAKARGATILGEIAGAGLTADAGDIVAPDVDGATSAMRVCLADADLSIDDINYISAHGTATTGNDKTETEAIKQAFGARARDIAVSSTKSMHGHCLGASGALELVACINAIRDSVAPPTINLTEADPECDLDYVADGARSMPIRAALSNSFAFGGSNAVIAVKGA